MAEKAHGPEPARASIYDIARAAGVNPSTVSRALNNRDRIGNETRLRIQRIAEELGYQPSDIARSLATNRTVTIGVVVPSFSDPTVGPVLAGIERQANDAGYRVLISTSKRDRDRELEIVQDFQRRRVDGVIIVTSHVRSTYEVFQKTLDVPLVVNGHEESWPDIAVVATDDRLSLRTAVQHLVDLGHSHLSYLGVEDRPNSNTTRLTAIQKAVLAYGTPVALTVVNPEGSSDLERGLAGYEILRSSGSTAVICYNDMTAIGVMSAAQRAGDEIPRDISVVGFDDIDIVAHLSHPLTTTRQPFYRMGRESVDCVLDLIAGGPKRHIVVPSRFVIRETTGPPSH